MATRSFLIESDVPKAIEILLASSDGSLVFPEQATDRRAKLSLWLEEALLRRLQALGDFTGLKPILLGSWSRHELCPKSDIDLLFAGEETQVQEFVAKAFRAGLKLRSRTPEDPKDWSLGVEPFDILALSGAQALTPEGGVLLTAQRETVATVRHRRRTILSAIRRERDERRKRQDSISNYLEPNLKYGTGGLRDIEQALAVRRLFPDKFADVEPYPFAVLMTIKNELLFLRCALHLLGGGDILSAHEQLELALRLRMESPQTLMKFVQSELERASFYADWAVANAFASTKLRQQSRVRLRSLDHALARLRASPDLLLQFQIRLKVDKLVKRLSPHQRGKALHRALVKNGNDAYLVSLHRTRILEALVPDLKKLRGWVQHDHYHRFTADAHLVQTIREVQRAKTQRRSLGVMAKLTADLSASEWLTLKLTALFHDLAKGRKGDHSTEGAKLVEKYFVEWGYADSLKQDVHWLVTNHLLVSTAAFRQNPQAQSTWQRLFERGVHGRRLILLALFTAIDIRATNPEAWTEWKAKLLLDLVESLRSNQARNLQKHWQIAGTGRRRQAVQEWLLNLDPVLLETLSPRVLLADLEQASAMNGDLPPKVLRIRGRLWVRFHSRKDQTGLFLSYVKRLYGLGLNIQMSSVSTLNDIGVYDWFCLRTEKSLRQVSQWLTLGQERQVNIPQVEFQSIDLMAQDQDEWIFSFRGRDQRGLLMAAAQALVEENLALRWARAHTWGQQIDDIFSVQPAGEVAETLRRLRERFVT